MELLPCPFCGGSPQIYDNVNNRKSFRISCLCGICNQWADYEKAIRKWNTRQPPSSKQPPEGEADWDDKCPECEYSDIVGMNAKYGKGGYCNNCGPENQYKLMKPKSTGQVNPNPKGNI